MLENKTRPAFAGRVLILQREFILRLPQELAGKPHLILEYRLGVRPPRLR
jgi:hypothetical protein